MNIHKYFQTLTIFFLLTLGGISPTSASNLSHSYDAQKNEIFSLPNSAELPLEYQAERLTSFFHSVWDYCFLPDVTCPDNMTHIVFQGMYHRGLPEERAREMKLSRISSKLKKEKLREAGKAYVSYTSSALDAIAFLQKTLKTFTPEQLEELNYHFFQTRVSRIKFFFPEKTHPQIEKLITPIHVLDMVYPGEKHPIQKNYFAKTVDAETLQTILKERPKGQLEDVLMMLNSTEGKSYLRRFPWLSNTKGWLPVHDTTAKKLNTSLKNIIDYPSVSSSQRIDNFMKIFDEENIILPPYHMDDMLEKMRPQLTTKEKSWFFHIPASWRSRAINAVEMPSGYLHTGSIVIDLEKEMFFEKHRPFAELSEKQKKALYDTIESDYQKAIYATIQERYPHIDPDEVEKNFPFVDAYTYIQNPNIRITPLNQEILDTLVTFNDTEKKDFDEHLFQVRIYRLREQFPHIYIDEIAREVRKADFGKRAAYEIPPEFSLVDIMNGNSIQPRKSFDTVVKDGHEPAQVAGVYTFLKNLRDTKDPYYKDFQSFFQAIHPLTEIKKLEKKSFSATKNAIQKTKTLPQKYQNELTDFIIIEHVLYVGEYFPEMSKTSIINAVFPLHKNQEQAQKKDIQNLKKREK